MSDISQPTGTVEERVARAKEATSRISLTDTEPLDLDAVYDRWIDWYNGTPSPNRWPHRDAGESMSHCLAREDVPALISEVRRLREEALVHRYILESGRWYFEGKGSGDVGEWWIRQINRSFADPKDGDLDKARDWFESKGGPA